MNRLLISRFACLLAVTSILFLSSCGDGPTAAEGEHLRPLRGFRAYDVESGRRLVSLTFWGDDIRMGIWEGGIEVPPGGEREVEVRWIDDGGTEFVLEPALHPRHALNVELADSSTVTVSVQGNRARFVAVGAGGTQADFQLVHGDHLDWNSDLHAGVSVR